MSKCPSVWNQLSLVQTSASEQQLSPRGLTGVSPHRFKSEVLLFLFTQASSLIFPVSWVGVEVILCILHSPYSHPPVTMFLLDNSQYKSYKSPLPFPSFQSLPFN